MDALKLHEIRVAVLAMNGVEETEIVGPVAALRTAGASVDIVSESGTQLQAFSHLTPSVTVAVDKHFADVVPEYYDALLLPGGALNADALRVVPTAQAFAASFDFADKPIAAFGHGALLLVSADVLKSRTLTGASSIHDDIENAGGTWVDEPIVIDGNLMTAAQTPDGSVFAERVIGFFSRAEPRPLQHS